MNCRQAQELLPDYSVELLTGPSREALQTHLAGCEDCRQALRELDESLTLVERFGGVNPPPGLFNAVRNEITRPDFRQTQRPWWWSWLHAPSLRAVAMTAAAAALAFSLISLRGGVNGGSQPESLPLTLSLTSQNRSAVASAIQQHALSATEGPLGDNVAWEAMAQLAEMELEGNSARRALP